MNKLVTDLSNNKEDDDNEQETSETKTEVFALKTEVFAFASRSKAEAKPGRSSTACSSSRIVPICERIWTDILPGTRSNLAYPVSKQLSTLLRHGDLLREKDGAIEFWRLQDYLRNEFENSRHWSDEMWKSRMVGGGGNKKRFQYCTDPSGQEILYLRALQGNSGRNPIDPTLQDNVLIPNNFFEYINHIGCAVNLHSIANSGLIATGQNSSRERQTVFSTACESHDKEHNDPYKLWLDPTTSCIVQAEVEKTPGYGVLGRFSACSTERIEVLSNKIERNHPLRYTPSLLCLEIYVSPRPPPKISYKDNLMCDLDFDVAGSSKDNQRIQPKHQSQLSNTGRPVCGQESTERCVLTPTHVEEDQTSAARPVLVDQKEEHEIDFRVPGLSHTVVTEAEHLRVQELVKKIENPPHREALHADLQQNNVYNHSAKNRRR